MKKRILLIISIFVVVLILFSSSYALLFKSNQTDKQEYTTGMLEITSETLSGSVTLNNPLPMSDSDGENTTPYVFRITNTGNLTYKFNIMLLSTTTDNQISSNYIKLKVNTDTPVKLNSLTDGIILSNITLKPGKSIDVTLRVWLSEDTPNTEIGKTFNAKITTEGQAVYTESPAKETLTRLGLTESTGTPDFSKTSCSSGCGESTVGIYKTKDDIGDSYYFRGDVENNYVYFANYYWRIIRINGDGSVRMIYAGTSAHENGYDDSSTNDMSIGTSAFNTNYNDNAYVGFMYGTTGASDYATTHANTNDSTIKKALDTWYTNNIKNTDYEQYIADAIYCNDREISTANIAYLGDGAGKHLTAYKAEERGSSLKCNQVNDRFTVNLKVSGVTGNGALTNPIGLITADEVRYAGGLIYIGESANNTKYYLYTNYRYWTMSPDKFDGGLAYVFLLTRQGSFDTSENGVRLDYGVRPVISLSSGALSSGTGTKNDPFRLPDPEPNSPDIVDGLIPVVYDESTSNWVKGDSTNTNNSWYDYDNKLWANAVLVTSTNRSTYQNASVGTPIAESDILAYYVWIPRFKYKVWNINKVVGTGSYNAITTGIDIIFEEGKISSGTISCNYNHNVSNIDLSTTTAETCTGNNGDYYTHPAFTFGSDELRGFWMGKFEISSSNPTASNGGDNTTSLTVRVLPNVSSWRNKLSSFNTVVQNMQASSNIYGLSTSRTNTDSHIITNYEWGAVAYLTNSKYGRCTNVRCTEVTINNCSSRITGIGADSVSASESSTTCTTAANKYNGTKGVLASTTGNITGVYDMSGGTSEFVMGNMSRTSESYTISSSHSGFASDWYTTSTAKYVTTYAYDRGNSYNQAAYNRSRLGDATGEVVLSTGGYGGWNSDSAYFPTYNGDYSSWFDRGGDYSSSTHAGVFSFFNENYSEASRAVLVSFSA